MNVDQIFSAILTLVVAFAFVVVATGVLLAIMKWRNTRRLKALEKLWEEDFLNGR